MDPDLHPVEPPGVYRPATYLPALRHGDVVYIAGQVARDAAGELVAPHDAARQAEVVYANLRAVLEAAGTHPGRVVKVTTYLTHAEDSAAVSAVRQRFFGDHRPPHTGLIVAALGAPEVRVEVEAVAVMPSPSAAARLHPLLRSSASHPEGEGSW